MVLIDLTTEKKHNLIQTSIKYTKSTRFVEMYNNNNKKRYDETNGFDLIKMVSKPSKKLFISTYYDKNMLVKPYFDIDVKNTEYKDRKINKKKILKEVFETINNEFLEDIDDVKIIVADNSRFKKNKYFISFHIIVNSCIYLKVSNLLNIVRHFNHKNEAFDTNVYKDNGGILRFSNQYKDKSVKKAPRLYGYNKNLKPINFDLSHLIINKLWEQTTEHTTLLCDFQKVINKKKYKGGKKNFAPIKYNNNWIITDRQYILIKKMLNDLPPKEEDGYTDWIKIGLILFNYSNTEDSLELWDYWSSLGYKYEKGTCKDKWRQFKLNTNTPLTIGTLIHEHIEYCKKNKKGCLEYTHLHKPIPYKALEGIENLKKLKVKNISSEYLTTKELKTIDEIKKDLDDNKIIFIKSITGSGKTCLIQHLTRGEYGLSVVSRRSLAYFHYDNLDCINYIYDEKDQTHKNMTINKVYQLDSLWEKKCGFGDEYTWNLNLDELKEGYDYIVILDEFNSLINHIFADLPNMKQRRLEIVGNLIKIIKGAKKVLCFDADLSTSTVQFIYENLNDEEMILINNKSNREIKTVVNFYEKENIMIKKMIKDIKNKELFFCCSDRCGKLYENVISLFITNDELKQLKENDEKEKEKKEFIKLEGDNYIIYSGFKSYEKIDTNTWKNKFVFTTPTIIYGIDFNEDKTHKVYSFNYGNTISALGINQQINRIRKPKEINIYVSSKKTYLFRTWEKYLETYKTIKYEDDNLNITNEFRSSLNNLHKRFDFTELQLSSFVDYYLTQFLKNKGYKTINIIKEDKYDIVYCYDLIKKLTKKELINIFKMNKIKKYSKLSKGKMINYFFENQDKIEKIDNDIYTKIQKNNNIIQDKKFKDELKKNKTEIIKLYKSLKYDKTEKMKTKIEIINYIYEDYDLDKGIDDLISMDEIIFNNGKTIEFINIARIRNNKKYEVKDVEINKLLCDDNKIKLFNDFMKKFVKIESIDKFDRKYFKSIDKLKLNDLDMVNKIKLCFHIKAYKGQRINQLFGKMCRNMIPTFTDKTMYKKDKKQIKGMYIIENMKYLIQKKELKFIDD